MTGRVFLLLGVVLLAPGCTRDDGGTAALPAGSLEELEKSGRWAEAAAARRREALRLGPERGDEHVKRAMVAYLMANRLQEAEQFAGEVLAKDPKQSDVLFYLGDAQRVMNEHDRSRSTLEKLLERNPGHVKGTIALSHVLLRLGKAREALEHIDRLLEAGGAGAEQRALAEMDAARALRRLGRPAEAADRLAGILESDPFHPVAIAEAAQVFGLLGKKDLVRGQSELHAWLTARGHQLSSDDETKLHPTGPLSGQEAARLALQAADRRDFLRALEDLERLDALRGADDVVPVLLARLWMRLHRPQEALRVAGDAADRSPASVDLSRIRAEACRALGRVDEARDLLSSASRQLAAGTGGAPDDRDLALDTHMEAGLLWLEPGGSLETAAACFDRAAAAAPESWRPAYGSARVALERGESRKARELFESARERLPSGSPGPAELRRWSAAAKGLAGDLGASAREILALVRENPGEIENFKAFRSVFGSKEEEPEVARVLQLEKALEAKLEAHAALLGTLAAAPFLQSSSLYLEAGRSFLGQGLRDRALDCLLLSADLDRESLAGLRAAAAILTSPRDVFLRLRTLRRILERAPGDAAALEILIRAHLELEIRLPEAEALALRLLGVRPGGDSERLLTAVRERRGSG